MVDAVYQRPSSPVDTVNMPDKAMSRLPLISLATLTVSSPALASDLIVDVADIDSAEGEIGCALHANASEFPTGNATVASIRLSADRSGVVCQFSDLAPGTYAVAASHDLNGNRVTDTNFLGRPTEDWAVSNNVRHTVRALTFEAAQVVVAASGQTRVEVRLGR